MGAAAVSSLTKWIPKDDLLLMNAVEAGAPLEALSKGAVRFSRRFTVHELQDRWRSLLYDLDTSTEASERIVEVEKELAASNLLNAKQACNPNSIGQDSPSGKRKADSVRNHYHAMRKRICSEPCAARLHFADTGCDNGPTDQLKPKNNHPVDNFALEIPCSNDYGHPETSYDSGQHAFPELIKVDSAVANASHQLYHTGHLGSFEGEIRDGTPHNSCLFWSTNTGNNIPSAPCGDTECNNGSPSFEHNFQQRDFPNILGENLISLDNFSDVHETSQSNALGASTPYKTDDIGTQPLLASVSSNHEGVCSDFAGNVNLISHGADCNCSLDQFGYSTPPSSMPTWRWRTMEDVSTPTVPMDGHYGDMDDHTNIDAPQCDDASSQPKLDDAMSGAGLNNPTSIHENDLIDISDMYMEFTAGEGLLFIDMDEKDNMDISGPDLSSVLLSSPSGTHHGVANSNDLGATNVLETCLGLPDATFSEDPNLLCDQIHSAPENDRSTSVSGANMPYSSSQTSNTTEPQQEFMICVLNTQDLEIPNNDHVNFPDHASALISSSNLEQCAAESIRLVSSDGRVHVGDPNKVKEQGTIVQPTVSSLKTSSLTLPKIGVLHSCDGWATEAESSEGGTLAGVSTYAGSGVDEQRACKSGTVVVNSTSVPALKVESTDLTFQNQDNPDTSFAAFLENHLQESDDAELHPLNATDSYTVEAHMQAALQTCLPPHPNLVSAEAGFSDTVIITSTPNQVEQLSDTEDDVPYFSDIEALILDMDLDPYNEEPCQVSKEVSRYQPMDTKNTLRWEEGFHSHINRLIASHGAFAVFYGRHLKYFIKDPEVSIGRETNEEKVDIDLGREGRTKKISRLQAIIKMDEQGAFSLKNSGKFSIFVDGREVPTKGHVNLLSHSLVKIQNMYFAFEVNESAVRHHIKKLQQGSHEQNTFRFDWRPDQYP